MIKGAQKQMIVLRTGNSRYFDEAYFVLRREIKVCRGNSKNDMLKEANKILEECCPASPPKRRRGRALALFLLGLFLGVGSTVLAFLLL